MGPGAVHHRPGLGQQGIVHGVDQDDLFQIWKQRHQLSLNEGFVGHGGGGAAGALTQHPQAEDAVLEAHQFGVASVGTEGGADQFIQQLFQFRG